MKRIANLVEPTFNGIAKLIDSNGVTVEVPCKIWLPRHIYENAYFKFEDSLNNPKSIITPANVYKLQMEIVGFDNEKQNEIIADELYIEKYIISSTSGNTPSLLSFESEPQFVLVKQYLNQKEPHVSSKITFRLGDNFLLNPAKMIESSYTGEVKIKDVSHHQGDIEGIGRISFDRHYYYIDQKDGGKTQYSNLVAIVCQNTTIDATQSNINKIKQVVEDYLLLCSFASNQRTNIVGYNVVDSEGLIDVYYGHLEADDIGQARKHGHHDVLVDLLSFPEFIQSSFVLFSENEINKKELLRQAIYKVLPKKERTIETSILSLFSALETLVLIYRRDNDYEFTVPISNKWKKLEKQLKTIIRDLDVFPSGEHREMLIRMLPSLRRVPLKDAYNSLIDENLIYVEDLWTAFGPTDGYSLNDIRNHLSHGDSFDNEAMAALWNAMDNLEVLVKRMILSFFSWNISGTNISKENLERYGWVANQSLDKDMIDIKHHSKVITN